MVLNKVLRLCRPSLGPARPDVSPAEVAVWGTVYTAPRTGPGVQRPEAPTTNQRLLTVITGFNGDHSEQEETDHSDHSLVSKAE